MPLSVNLRTTLMLPFDRYKCLTFDCYGTLIDWETGLLTALRPLLNSHEITLGNEQILELFSDIEAGLVKGRYTPYKEVLVKVVGAFGERLGFQPTFADLNALVESIKFWLPFSDTVDALRQLKERYKLAVVSNIDDDLFAETAAHLQVAFDYVVTAEQARAYKPSLINFERAIERIGMPPDRILHVAQSLYHDIIPAKTIGLSTVWVNRRRGKEGFGATPPALAKPDLEVPDLNALLTIITRSA